MLKRILTGFFDLNAHQTTIQREVIAGVTTFMTMAYIIVVNPQILSETGMNQSSLITATILASMIATLIMAFYAKLPFGLAPGMGINAFFAYTIVLQMGFSWQLALTAVFLEGIIFLLLTFFNIREAIVNSIPINIKHAVSVGIGLFIALIGLNSANIVVTGMEAGSGGALTGNIVKMGNISSPTVLTALTGLVITAVLLALRIKGALLIGILLTTIIGIPFGVTQLPGTSKLVSLPPSIEPLFFKIRPGEIFSTNMLVVLFTLLFVDMFSAVGTLVGVGTKAGMLDEKGRLPRAKQALFSDAAGTTFGSLLGTSTVTTYVESAAGIAEGGRTGLTALVIALLFGLALFLSPLFLIIPEAATAPALVLVGFFMITPIKEINFNDYTEAFPAFLTIVIMPLTYSIAEGVVFGIISYVLLKVFTNRGREVSLLIYILAAVFILRFIIQ
jgi:AGZA family xanthine/uracil permease-like MFS transporter